jgi:hypothetical protein
VKHRHLIAYLSPPVISRVYKLKWQRTERRPAARVSPSASRAHLWAGMRVVLGVVTRARDGARAARDRERLRDARVRARRRAWSLIYTLWSPQVSRARVSRGGARGGRPRRARGPLCVGREMWCVCVCVKCVTVCVYP